MTEMRECSACGAISYDVRPKVVALDDGTYASELRCTDPYACQDRQDALEAEVKA